MKQVLEKMYLLDVVVQDIGGYPLTALGEGEIVLLDEVFDVIAAFQRQCPFL